MNKATGFAVVDQGIILVNTVSATRRAALVNWLMLNNFVVTNRATDMEIENAWQSNRPSSHSVEQVSIVVM